MNRHKSPRKNEVVQESSKKNRTFSFVNFDKTSEETVMVQITDDE